MGVAKIGHAGKHGDQAKKTDPGQLLLGGGTVTLSAKPGKPIRRKQNTGPMGEPMLFKGLVYGAWRHPPLRKFLSEDAKSLDFEPLRKKTKLIKEFPIGGFTRERATFFHID